MKKKILIGSIIAVAIIVLTSFSSVVGKVSSDDEIFKNSLEKSSKGESVLGVKIWGVFSSIEIDGEVFVISSDMKRLTIFGIKYDSPFIVFERRCSVIRIFYTKDIDILTFGNGNFQFLYGRLIDGLIHWEK